MCLLLFAWMPSDSPRLIEAQFGRFARALRLRPRQLGWLLSGLAVLTGLAYAGREGFGPDMAALDLGLGIWWWQTGLMFAALWSVRRADYGPAIPLLRPRFGALWFYVVFLAFNCLCPYIGLKTRTTLTMHSDLRTENGYWNHLLLPERMRLFTYQNDLVEVLSSDLPDFDHLRQKEMPLPYFEFRRWCRLARGTWYVEYRRNNDPVRRFEKSAGRGNDPELMKARPWLEWFLCFNPVGAKHDYIPALVKRTGPARNIVPTIALPEKD
jgi:hypothetical protein